MGTIGWLSVALIWYAYLLIRYGNKKAVEKINCALSKYAPNNTLKLNGFILTLIILLL